MGAADLHIHRKLDQLNEQTAKTNDLLTRLVQQLEYLATVAHDANEDSPPPPHLARRQQAAN